jgi:diamine N-acetyltransferase
MPTVQLRPIDRSNWRAALSLAVQPNQQRFVAGHSPIAAIVLAKAYVQAGGLEWWPYGIYDDTTIVGMLALAHRPGTTDEYWLYHFFIDQAHQGRGYGRRALAELVALFGDMHPACRQILLTVHPDNLPAQRLYASAGFRPTGGQIDGEPVYRLALAES